jgi:copper chaperone
MKYTVSPLTCGACVRSITQALLAVDPSATVHVHLDTGTLEADGHFDPDTVISTLAAIGYEAIPAEAGAGSEIVDGVGSCCGSCRV